MDMKPDIKYPLSEKKLQRQPYGDQSGEEDTGHCSAARVCEPLPARWHGRPCVRPLRVRMPTVVDDSSSCSVMPVILIAPTNAGYYTIAPSLY